MAYPKDSYILIDYDPTQWKPNLDQVTCSSNLQFNIDCQFTNSTQIKIAGVFIEDLSDNSFIKLTLTNFQNMVLNAE